MQCSLYGNMWKVFIHQQNHRFLSICSQVDRRRRMYLIFLILNTCGFRNKQCLINNVCAELLRKHISLNPVKQKHNELWNLKCLGTLGYIGRPWPSSSVRTVTYKTSELWCAGLVLSNESGQTGWAQWAKAEIRWCFVSSSNTGAQCAAMTLVVFAETPSWVSLIKWK